ncbi:MAG: NAD(P)H-dependent oxidoreductase [Saccharofermentans sp.]|nr:NAD(P)H-dependent oxidoreductase [Saccharofermentans sp.]
MKVFIVYCHPSEDSFTREILRSFTKGIEDSGGEYVISDLYKMGFDPVMSEKQYLRDAFYKTEPEVEPDIIAEQQKIEDCDVIAFVYPVFWTEAPAMLVGWFDRVWSYGYAYGETKSMKVVDKALFLVSAGNPIERLEEFGLLDAMKKVMLGDRFNGRAKEKEFIVFDSTSRETGLRQIEWDAKLKKAYEAGRDLCSN